MQIIPGSSGKPSAADSHFSRFPFLDRAADEWREADFSTVNPTY
jgi:hypothetical protein